MNGLTDRNQGTFDGLNGQGKDTQDMSNLNSGIGTIVSSVAPNRRLRSGGGHISRQRWLRLLTVLAGAMLLAMQAAPALAGSSSISRAALDNLDYRMGKEENLYGLVSAQLSPAPGSVVTLDPQASASFGSPGAGSADSQASIQVLEEAAEKLKESQQPDDADVAVEQEPAGDPADDQPAGDETQEAESELAQTGYTLAVTDDFTSGTGSVLWTGEHQGNAGFISEEDGGWYVMQIQPGLTFPLIATGQTTINDGAIVTSASFGGEGVGEVGLIGRSAIDYSAFYYCGADSYGGASCQYFDGTQWTELFRLAPGEVTRYDVDQLDLAIVGDTLTFYVNDTHVGSISGAGIAGGSWGVATMCYEGDCAGSFDYVDIYSFGAAADSNSDGDTGVTTVLASDLTENDLGLYVDSGDWGATTFVDGWYATQMAPGWWFPNTIAGTESVENGYLTAVVALDGAGSTGLVARTQYSDSGASYYVCWISYDAYAGCHMVLDGEWTALFVTEQPIELQDVNEISLGMFGAEIYFIVNGQTVVQTYDETLTGGAWGFFTEAFDVEGANGAISYVDSVTLDEYTVN